MKLNWRVFQGSYTPPKGQLPPPVSRRKTSICDGIWNFFSCAIFCDIFSNLGMKKVNEKTME